MAKKLPPKQASVKQGPRAAVPMSPAAPMASPMAATKKKSVAPGKPSVPGVAPSPMASPMATMKKPAAPLGAMPGA